MFILLNTIRPEIPKRAQGCIQCQELFKPGHQVASWLYQNEEGIFLRDDLCIQCVVKNEYREKEETLIHWKAKVACVKIKKPSSKSIQQEELAYELFHEERLKEAPDSKQKTFILSLFLARKKRLFPRGEKNREKGLSYYEDAQTGELIEVPLFQVQLIPVEEIKRELALAISHRMQTLKNEECKESAAVS